MTPEITELIKKKAEEAIQIPVRADIAQFERMQKAHADGQIEAIEMMVGFMLWADDNYWRLGNKDEWVYEIGEDDSPVFTTIELLTKYIKEFSQPN